MTSAMSETRSTLKRPAKRAVQAFDLEQIGADTVRTYLAKGYSLAICCKDCPRIVEWTPAELDTRFGDRLDLGIADIARRLRCTGVQGCGSARIAVFPHLYDGRWAWSPPD